MENNEVLLSEYLQIGVDLEAGTITPEESVEKFNTFFSKLVIKNYMKHKDKVLQLAKILINMNDMTDVAANAAFLEMSRVFEGLFKYCVNLKDDVNVFKGLYVVYDAVVENGLYDYILQFCRQDYDVFSQMLTDALNIDHLQNLMNSVILFSEQDFKQWEVALKDLNNKLTPELLTGLINLNMQNSEATQELLHSLAEVAANDSSRHLNDHIARLDIVEQQAVKKNMTHLMSEDGEN